MIVSSILIEKSVVLTPVSVSCGCPETCYGRTRPSPARWSMENAWHVAHLIWFGCQRSMVLKLWTLQLPLTGNRNNLLIARIRIRRHSRPLPPQKTPKITLLSPSSPSTMRWLTSWLTLGLSSSAISRWTMYGIAQPVEGLPSVVRPRGSMKITRSSPSTRCRRKWINSGRHSTSFMSFLSMINMYTLLLLIFCRWV